MKTIKFYLAAIAVFALLLTSCSKDEVGSDNSVSDNVASLALGPILKGADLNRQQITPDDTPECSGLDPAFAQIRLVYGDSDTEVITIVPILLDDQGLFTAYSDDLEIPIPSGETTVSVTLTDFVVWTDDGFGNPGEIIWVAPREGSEFDMFVDDALDSDEITLRAGSKNYVNVDVICYDDRDVNLYGYQFFDITPIPLYDFCIFANYCTDEGRHYTADYTLTIYEYDAETETVGDEIFMDSPNKGMMEDGTHWADPLCAVIPGPGDADSDEPYLYFEATLNDWAPYYTSEDDDEDMISGYLTWDLVESLLDRDGDDDTTNYWHIFFNCEEADGPSGSVAVPQ